MSLLGSMILDPEVISDILPLVSSASDFYSEAHSVIFDALVKLYDRRQSGDLVQLTEALRDVDALADVGGSEYLLSLAEGVPSAANAVHYAGIVREKSQLRGLIEAAGQIVYDAYHAGDLGEGGARTVLDAAERAVFDVTEKAAGADGRSLHELLHEALDAVENNDGRLVTGVATGYRKLDEMSAGLQPGEMTIIAARPSMGKTALALNIAEQIAQSGHSHDTARDDPRCGVAFFSLEMSQASVTQRLLSSHSGVDSHRIRTNQLSREHYEMLMKSCGQLAELPIYIDDTPGLTVMQLRAKARRLKKRKELKIGAVVIDYLQLMSAPEAQREGRQQEVSLISRQVKALARELEVPVVCLAQLNRGAEQREGHRPRMADLRESGSIEQDADVIILLHREAYYHRDNKEWAETYPEKADLAELIIAKQRNGPTGVVELTWDSGITRFVDRGMGRGGGYGGGGGGYGEAKPAGGAGAAFAGRPKSGPVDDFRDGGGDRDRGAGGGGGGGGGGIQEPPADMPF